MQLTIYSAITLLGVIGLLQMAINRLRRETPQVIVIDAKRRAELLRLELEQQHLPMEVD